jgi:hypothetical protein
MTKGAVLIRPNPQNASLATLNFAVDEALDCRTTYG